MMLTDKNDNKQAKVLNDLASFYVSSTSIDFTPPGSPHKVTPPSSDSEQDQPSAAIDPSQLEAFSNLFVNNNSQDGTSRRRKSHHPQKSKQSVVAVAMATSVDKDFSRRPGLRRGPVSMSRLDCEDDYIEMEIPLKGEEEDDFDNVAENSRQPREPTTTEEKGLSALEKLKRRSQSVDVRRVQRSRSDDIVEMDHGRRSSSQDARRRARQRRNGEDGMDGSLHSTAAKVSTEGFSALEKLKARSSSMERKRVAPGRSQSDDLLERELRQFCSNQDNTRRRHSHGHHHEDDDDRSKCTQSTAASKGGESAKVNSHSKEENPRPVSSRSVDRSLNPPVRRKSSDLLDMGSSHRPQSVRKHRSSSETEDETTASSAHNGDKTLPLKSDDRSSGSSEKPHSRASSRERRRGGLPERSKSDDLVDLDPNRHSHSHDGRRRARRSSGDDSSVVSTEIRPSSMHGIVVRKNSAESEGSQGIASSTGQVVLNTDDHSNTSSEKPRSTRSSSRERRRAAPEGTKSENALLELHKTDNTLGSHIGKRRGRRPTGEDASYVESIADTPKVKNSSLDGRGSRHSTRGGRPAYRSKSVDVAFEMDVSRRSATTDEQRRRRHRATSKTRENLDNLDDKGEVVKPASEISLLIDVQKKPQSARDASRIMAMHSDEGDNERKESLRQERRARSSSQAKWADLRRGMESIDKAQAHLEERRNGRHARRGAAPSDTSSVVSSSTERSSRANPRADKDRERSSRGNGGSSDGPSQPISDRRIRPSESFDAKGPPKQVNTPSSIAPPDDATADRVSEVTKSDQISSSQASSSSTSHSVKTESQDESDKVEPKKPQSSAFRTLLGANLIKKTSSTASTSDESGGVAPVEPISNESMHKGRTKGMNVLKKLLTAPSATSSEKAETVDTTKKGTMWGGLKSGVDFTSRLIRATTDSKKTNADSEKDELATCEEGTTVTTTSCNEIEKRGSPPQENRKDASSHQHTEGPREDSHESEDISMDRSSNHMRATDSHLRPPVGQPKSYSRNEKADPVPPAPADSASLISPELLEILNGAPTPGSVEQQRNGDRRGGMKGLAAPSLRFEGNQVDKAVPRFQPDTSTILEVDEDLLEDKSNSRHLPGQRSERGDEVSIVDENQGIIVGDSDSEQEPDDDPDTFLSPLKCMQLNFKPTFSPAENLLVAIHALDHEKENDESDDDESVKVHPMKMDSFELFDERSPPLPEASDMSMDDKDVANNISNTRQQEMAAEFEFLQRQLCESRVRIQASNEALRILQREMQQQTKLFEETKRRGRALKRVLREQNVLLLFN